MKNVVMIRKTKEIKEEGSPKGALFLYENKFGRIVLKLVTKRFVSLFAGKIMNTKFSCRYIEGFIKSNHIDMSEYPKEEYISFNNFFSRKIDLSYRPFSSSKKDLIAPADSKLLVYQINPNLEFTIKNKPYTLTRVLRDEKLAKQYQNGYLLVFRLSVDNYHRYHFIDDGKVLSEKKIKGILHTVGPIAFERYHVLEENTRTYQVLKTENFGKIIQMEVGAMMVGKIVNHKIEHFCRGEEKGYFLFGGSTVVVIIKANTVKIDIDILENSKKGIETAVKFGETIGKREKND